jgi:hypothetical protein
MEWRRRAAIGAAAPRELSCLELCLQTRRGGGSDTRCAARAAAAACADSLLLRLLRWR